MKRFGDEFGFVHLVKSEIDRGGQGVVYRTSDPNIAVKLVLDAAGNEIPAGHFAHRLSRLRSLPLPKNLNLSMPAAVLSDTAGYVMRLLDDMVSLRHFEPTSGIASQDGNATRPGWLSGLPESDAMKLAHYAKTGGVARRLLALYKAASTLARLHAGGLVYGDMSPSNVFVSRDIESREVWLIDADNLRFETASARSAIYTPGFGAPEVVQGLSPGTQRSDSHAFAAMAYWILTLVHPFVGEYVESGGEADWADEPQNGISVDLQADAYAGKLPWVQDLQDTRNHTNKGLPRSLVLTPMLETLFQETFGPGRLESLRRPSMLHWPAALAQAFDQSRTCAACGMGSFVDEQRLSFACPFCESSLPDVLKVTTFVGNDDDCVQGETDRMNQAWTWFGDFPSHETSYLPERLFSPFSLAHGDEDFMEIRFSDGVVELHRGQQSSGNAKLSFAPSDLQTKTRQSGNFKGFHGRLELDADQLIAGVWIRCERDQIRFVHLEYCKGVA